LLPVLFRTHMFWRTMVTQAWILENPPNKTVTQKKLHLRVVQSWWIFSHFSKHFVLFRLHFPSRVCPLMDMMLHRTFCCSSFPMKVLNFFREFFFLERSFHVRETSRPPWEMWDTSWVMVNFLVSLKRFLENLRRRWQKTMQLPWEQSAFVTEVSFPVHLTQ
jgi:hypothetical protein